MVGQRRPSFWQDWADRFAAMRRRMSFGCLTLCALTLYTPCEAAQTTVRLRFAWGSSAVAKQRWAGLITIEDGSLADLQPLGIEADAPVALRIEGNRLVIDPMEKRDFDGCDVTIQADEQATIRFELRADKSLPPTVVEVPLSQLAREQLRSPLGKSGGFLLAQRSPGDQLRVVLSRDHLVFQPNEVWNLGVQPDLIEELVEGPLQLGVQLRRTGDSKVLWQTTRQVNSDSTDEKSPFEFEIICPDQEGAYRLLITARHQESFATRFLPGSQAKPLVRREVEFVVVDPATRQPLLVDRWQPVLSINPANPRWWQRMPAWAQVPRLRGGTLGSVGNVQPVVRSGPIGDLVELPSAPAKGDPYWQSYTLPVRETGVPHVLELQYPLALEQHLAISVIEPDAAGRVVSLGRDSGLYSKGLQSVGDGEMGTHRFIFWPRTRSPQLLIVNHHPTKIGQYGKISLLRHAEQTADVEEVEEIEPSKNKSRLIACYLDQPILADYLGAAELLDTESGLSVQTWATFLDSANRLAQQLRLSGYNSVVLSVAANGSALFPSASLSPSPRYDSGQLASSGQDPLRKDVLEMLLRVFDREGLRVVPMVQLATPLPQLEQLNRNSDAAKQGIAWIGPEGKTWLTKYSTNHGRAPHYNVLQAQVQNEIGQLARDLADRYSHHASFAGVGLQLSGEGYGILPGLTWGMDDTTIANFSHDTGVDVPSSQKADRFHRRAQQLLGPNRQQWQTWRSQKLTQMYTQIAKELTAKRSDLRLVLATEDVFAGPKLQQRVRKAISEPVDLSQVLLEHGLDLAQLNQTPGIVALAPFRLGTQDSFQRRALDLRINTASGQGELLPLAQRSALLFHHTAQRLRLPSFDERSPFDPDRTQLTLMCQSLPAGAAQRQSLVDALAQSDAQIIVDGGPFLPFGSHAQSRNLLKTLQQLPGPETKTHTQTVQPLVMRVYQSTNSTTVVLINEAPWPIRVQLPLRPSQRCTWRKLGNVGETTSNPPTNLSGTLAKSDQNWSLELKPYDFQAWTFDLAELRIEQPQVSLGDVAREDLQQRIAEIESRTDNLNIRRPYAQLQNPGFELEEQGVRILGWQPRLGSKGRVHLDTDAPHSGTRALRLQSQDADGVAVLSNLFPIPKTGQLLLSGYVRGINVSSEARLYIVFEESNPPSEKKGDAYRQYAILGGEQTIGNKWSKFEFPVNDLPFGSSDQMRVQFHLTGNADLRIDDLELFDLQFDKHQRGTLVKGVYAAKTALEEGQVIDCLHLVDEYWSQYLVEYVPSTKTTAVREAKRKAPPSKVERPGFGDRLRGWVPKIWR